MWGVGPAGLQLAVTFNKTANGILLPAYSGNEFNAPLSGLSLVTHLDVVPPRGYSAGYEMSANDSSPHFIITTVPGTTVEIDMTATLMDSTVTTSSGAYATVVNADMPCWAFLDQGLLPANRVLAPVGATNYCQ